MLIIMLLIFNDQTEELYHIMSESMQYQSVIQLLLSKLNTVKQEISHRDFLIEEQFKLIQSYQQANEKSQMNSNKIYRGVLKASREARMIDELVFSNFTAQHAKNEQLEKENDALRRMIQINQEWKEFPLMTTSMNTEKPNINHLMKAKSTETKIDYGEFNPFNRNFKMKKFGESKNISESHESRLINMALA